MLSKETLGNGDAGSLHFIFTAVVQSLKLSTFEFWVVWFVYFFKTGSRVAQSDLKLYYIVENDLGLLTFLSLPLKHWDYECVPPCQASMQCWGSNLGLPVCWATVHQHNYNPSPHNAALELPDRHQRVCTLLSAHSGSHRSEIRGL